MSSMIGRFMALISILACIMVQSAMPQVGVFTKEELIQYTPQWKGERFPDGRPKVPDELLQRMKGVSIEEAWAVCNKNGYTRQYEGGWVLNISEPVLVGRALTAQFMPLRPDVNDVIAEKGKKDGRIGGENSWVIDKAVKGDVLVIDMMGKVVDGTFMGDNLGNSIWAKTGTGVVIDGGARDIEGNLEIPNFPVFNRGWDPSYLKDAMLMGINVPLRIGVAAVMPGDVVLGKKEGVIFIPAHLAQEVVETSEVIRMRDQFGHQRLREGVYTPGQIDKKWTDEIEKDFTKWLKAKGDTLTAYQKEKLLKGRTW
jgi:4-hydroxy-4-methyl-2-oxoglutarate aldolase